MRVGKTRGRVQEFHPLSEHPHARGENTDCRRDSPGLVGTSPRAWGKLAEGVVIFTGHRNIPTRVGKTCGPDSPGPRSAEHPHARGENCPGVAGVLGLRGTSPRAWGKLLRVYDRNPPRRNIPTRVGKTAVGVSVGGLVSEHPHARGENAPGLLQWLPVVGTSPRAWGKPLSFRFSLSRLRNIPTRVGKTPPWPKQYHPMSEHPHARGENLGGLAFMLDKFGTSPRAWGKLTQGDRARFGVRNIPTRVGKTIRCAERCGAVMEHPHARGENEKHDVSQHDSAGTSPRAWGKHGVC